MQEHRVTACPYSSSQSRERAGEAQGHTLYKKIWFSLSRTRRVTLSWEMLSEVRQVPTALAPQVLGDAVFRAVVPKSGWRPGYASVTAALILSLGQPHGAGVVRGWGQLPGWRWCARRDQLSGSLAPPPSSPGRTLISECPWAQEVTAE